MSGINPLGIEGGPSQEQIDGWKKQFGDIWVAAFSDNDKYVYRALSRVEWKQMIGNPEATARQTFNEEKTVQTCVLWPKLDVTEFAAGKAGTPSTLCELIMTASNFGILTEPVKL